MQKANTNDGNRDVENMMEGQRTASESGGRDAKVRERDARAVAPHRSEYALFLLSLVHTHALTHSRHRLFWLVGVLFAGHSRFQFTFSFNLFLLTMHTVRFIRSYHAHRSFYLFLPCTQAPTTQSSTVASGSLSTSASPSFPPLPLLSP